MSATTDTPSDALLVIPGDTTAAFVGADADAFPLGAGDLVVLPPDGVADAAAVLVLKVGAAAFTLRKTTLFGTIADDLRTYVFHPDDVPNGYVRITLPADVADPASQLSAQQDTLDTLLVRAGLLKAGLDAHADELARSAQEGSAALAAQLTGAARAHISATPPGAPLSVDPRVHGALRGLQSGARTAAGAGQRASDAVGAHVMGAGAWAATYARGTDAAGQPAARGPEESALRSAASTAVTTGAALGASARVLGGAAGSAVSGIVGHAYGADAARAADAAGTAARDVAGAAGSVGKMVSAGWYGGRGALGALDVRDPEQAEALREEAKEMQAQGEVEKVQAVEQVPTVEKAQAVEKVQAEEK